MFKTCAPLGCRRRFLQHNHHSRAFSNTSSSSSRRIATVSLYSVSVLSLSLFTYAYYDYTTSTNLPFNLYALLRPILFRLDAERAHNLAVRAYQLPKPVRNALGMVYKNGRADPSALDNNLETKVWHLSFANPVGIAAGFDKHGQCIDGLFDTGFGFVEIGSVCPKPQPGNDRPRVWRLPKDEAVINRYGFNSVGHDSVRQRLHRRLSDARRHSFGKLGVNLGKNKYVTEANAVDDYVKGIEAFCEYADYLVINVSSPNTPGLRDLQRREVMQGLLATLRETRDRVHNQQFASSPMAACAQCKPPPPPLLVKIAPDLSDAEIEDIAAVVQQVGIDGIIVSNTTIARDGLRTDASITAEYGGLSGKPVFEKSNDVLRKMYKACNGQVPLIGVGGISSVEDAYTKIKCGASLVQLYTSVVYKGPTLIHDIIEHLDEMAKKDGYQHISEAVGAAVEI